MSNPRLGIVALLGILLLAGLIGGGAFASRQGWQPPSWLSFLNRSSQQAQPVDVGLFCHEHGVPEKFCTLCHAELKDKLLLCKEHGNIPEDICTICHPENEQKYGLKMMCPEHGVPEPFCVQCNPGLAAGEVPSDWCSKHGIPKSLCTICDPTLRNKIAMCAEHDVPESLCTICKPELAVNFVTCADHKLPVAFCPPESACLERLKQLCAVGQCVFKNGQCMDGICTSPSQKPAEPTASKLPRVQLAGAEIATQVGMETAPVMSRPIAPRVVANAEVGYDETRLARIRPRVSGIVHDVRVNVGDTVRKGDVLAVVDSAELGQAKADYLAMLPMVKLWQANAERLRGLEQSGVVAGKRLLEAEAELGRARAQALKARQTLQNLGLESYQIGALPEEPENERNLLCLVAPQDGTIVKRHVVSGEAVQATSELFAVADLSTMWVHVDLYESDLSHVAIGQPVVFRVPGLAPAEFTGRIAWIDSQVDPRTRTIHVRAHVHNRDGLLRANMFGTATIQIGEQHEVVSVPRAALQWEGSSYVVFVKTQADLFEPRRVLKGREIDGDIELAWADLKSGDPVVTTGSFLLKTEIMKGSIGAGCCGE